MKTKLRIILAAVITLSFSSCYLSRPLVSQPSDNNMTYKVDYLFEHDGCKVYRFYDYGRYVYFTNCSGSVTAINNDSTHTETINVASGLRNSMDSLNLHFKISKSQN